MMSLYTGTFNVSQINTLAFSNNYGRMVKCLRAVIYSGKEK